jgi:hypothetical protein
MIFRIAAAACGLCMVTSLSACVTSKPQVPRSLCRTPVSPELSAPLLGSGVVSEWTSASFREPASSSWCVVHVDRKEVLQLWFSAGGGKPDLGKLAMNGPTIGLFDPHPVEGIGEQAVVANNGAMASTPCRDSGGADSFLLAVKLTKSPMKPGRERDVERFMRAYMPATVKSLNCLPR